MKHNIKPSTYRLNEETKPVFAKRAMRRELDKAHTQITRMRKLDRYERDEERRLARVAREIHLFNA